MMRQWGWVLFIQSGCGTPFTRVRVGSSSHHLPADVAHCAVVHGWQLALQLEHPGSLPVAAQPGPGQALHLQRLRAVDLARHHQLRHGQRQLYIGASDAHPHPRRTSSTICGATPALPASAPLGVSEAPNKKLREYIYLPEAEIAPTRQARTQVDRPVALMVHPGSLRVIA
jgi:hypothetical protein